MIEISYLKEQDSIKLMPQNIKEVIWGILMVLESEYGRDRKYEDDGGYVMGLEKKEDFMKLRDKSYIDCDDVIAEYVDKTVCSNGEVYANSLILCNNDYEISLIIPMELTPQNLKDYMIE
ncbi:hypothetical protein KPL26_10980 [Clostridium algidicarnis]|uniref:hypothetical protein n=1 Tax=Clostridium algidicarnis TaxID=37659 RepID=UPI001C0D7C0D|nr:hypothetical protein [Clostridium algidicarnis]MBU3197200.1 hypothetical protein [Clostridium algidicarnis]